MEPRSLELLSPARDAATGRIAILAGADAVYIGAPAFGARAAAANSVADIAALCDFAHQYSVRIYVTMNTLLFDNELDDARRLVWELYRAGVDALIVQDMAYLMMDLPPIALHASTQCDIRTPEKAARLAHAGFSQLVLPREFTLEQIRRSAEAAGVPVEVFVHGALCVSYSGDCQAGFMAMGRSANRGVCPQICRLAFDLVDDKGRIVAPRKHYLSLRDLNQSNSLADLIDAGASSFKIEGRLKDPRYVANVTAAYSQRLNQIIAASGGSLRRASYGSLFCNFTPDLNRTFNRGYTSYFLKGKATRMASIDTPKWAGVEVGTVTGAYDPARKAFTARLAQPLANGDGLGYFDPSGQYCGFGVNRVDGFRIFPATPQPDLRPGTKLYRNVDKAFFDLLDRAEHDCSRSISVDITLRAIDDQRICLSAVDERSAAVSLVVDCPNVEAKTPQHERRKEVMSKTGGTVYTIGTLTDDLGTRFVAASVLAGARRRLLTLLDQCARARYERPPRAADSLPADAFAADAPLTYHDNVANRLAERFYLSHGASIAQQALEVKKPTDDETVVMTTRYCLRRELGCCLREGNARALPRRLFLRNNSGVYRLDCHCDECCMKVVRCKSLPSTQ